MPRAHGEGQRRQRIVSEMREVEKKGRTMGWGFETCALLMIWKNRNSAEGLGGDGLDWGWVAATWDHYSVSRCSICSLRLCGCIIRIRGRTC